MAKKLFVNPYTGALQDFDKLNRSAGGAVFCSVTGQPLNAEAVKQFAYSGPAEDRAAWEADAVKVVKAIEAEANQANHETMGVGAADKKK